MLIPKPYYQNSFVNEILAGITTSLLVIPEALFFSFIAGIDPLIGISSYLLIGLITAIFGGKPGLISGPEKVSAMLLASIIAEYGTFYLVPSTIIIGGLQFLTGYFRLGKFIRLISKSTLLGFINGVAISIIITQLQFFKKDMIGSTEWLHGSALYFGIAAILIVAAIIYYGSFVRRYIPPSLTAIILLSLIAYFFNLPLETLEQYFDRIGINELWLAKPFHYWTSDIEFSIGTFISLLPKVVFIAFVTIINSLVSLAFVDEITQERGVANKELTFLGISSAVSGLLGFLPGSCMLGQSILNVRVGGQQRISAIASVVSVLFLVVLLKPLLLQIPLVVLFAVMLMMVIGTFSWTSIKHLKSTPPTDAFVLISVSCFTIISNVGIAIFFGIIVSSLVFAWENARRIRLRKKRKKDGTRLFEVYGPLFFASSRLFIQKFEEMTIETDVEISFRESRIWDQSGIEALYKVCELCSATGNSVTLSYLSGDTKRLIRNTEIPSNIEIVSSKHDPTYKVVTEITE